MRVYVASNFGEMRKAKGVAEYLENRGHTVVSTWHDTNPNSPYWPNKSLEAYMLESSRCLDEVARASALVLLAADTPAKGGKFVETGAALAYGKPVVYINDRQPENFLLYHPGVARVNSIAEAAKYLDTVFYPGILSDSDNE